VKRVQAFDVGGTPGVAGNRGAHEGLMQRRVSRGGGKLELFGHASVALPAKGYETRHPEARTCILRGDGREGNGVGQTMSPSEEGVRRPARPRVPRVQSAVETGAFAVLNEDRYALLALTPDGGGLI